MYRKTSAVTELTKEQKLLCTQLGLEERRKSGDFELGEESLEKKLYVG